MHADVFQLAVADAPFARNSYTGPHTSKNFVWSLCKKPDPPYTTENAQWVSLYSGFSSLCSGFSSVLSEAGKAFFSICRHFEVALEIIFNSANTSLCGSRALKMQLRAVNPIFYRDEQVLQEERAWRQLYSTHPIFHKTQQDRFMSGVIPLPPEHFHLGKLALEESSTLQLSTQGPVFLLLLFPQDHISFLGLAIFFRWAGHSTRSTSSASSKKNDTHVSPVENWYKNQRQAGCRATDLVNRPCTEVVFSWNLTKRPFSLWFGAPMPFHLCRRSLVHRRVMWARPGASHYFNVAASGLDSVWDLEH